MDRSASKARVEVTRKENKTMKKTKALKPAIRQNQFGNWNGYLGGRKVEMFFGQGGCGGEQEWEAKQWLANQLEMKRVVEQPETCNWRVWRRGAWECCNQPVAAAAQYCAKHEQSAHRKGK